MKKLLFSLLILTGCTNSGSPKQGPTQVSPSEYQIDLMSFEQDGLTISDSILNFGPTSESLKEVSLVLNIINSSTSSRSLSFDLGQSEGYKIKTNRCEAQLAAKKSCKITISFANRGLYDGLYRGGLEIISGASIIAIQLEAQVSGKLDPNNGAPILEVTLNKSFDDSDDHAYRTLSIKNIGTGTARNILATLPSTYRIRLNRCPTDLLPGKECYIQLLLVNFRHAQPTAGSVVVTSNSDPHEIVLSEGIVTPPSQPNPAEYENNLRSVLAPDFGWIADDSRWGSSDLLNNEVYFGYLKERNHASAIYKVNLTTAIGSDALNLDPVSGVSYGESIYHESPDPEGFFTASNYPLFDRIISDGQRIFSIPASPVLSLGQEMYDYFNTKSPDLYIPSRILRIDSGLLMEVNKPVLSFKDGFGNDTTFNYESRYTFARATNSNYLWKYNGEVYSLLNARTYDTAPEGYTDRLKTMIVKYSPSLQTFVADVDPVNGRLTAGLYGCNETAASGFVHSLDSYWNLASDTPEYTLLRVQSYGLGICENRYGYFVFDKQYNKRSFISESSIPLGDYIYSGDNYFLFVEPNYWHLTHLDRITGDLTTIDLTSYSQGFVTNQGTFLPENLKNGQTSIRYATVFNNKIYFCNQDEQVVEISNFKNPVTRSINPVSGLSCIGLLNTDTHLFVQRKMYVGEKEIRSLNASGQVSLIYSDSKILGKSGNYIMVETELTTDVGQSHRISFHNGSSAYYPWGTQDIRQTAHLLFTKDYISFVAYSAPDTTTKEGLFLFKNGTVKRASSITDHSYNNPYHDSEHLLFYNQFTNGLSILDIQ